jgi:hypothetical protein
MPQPKKKKSGYGDYIIMDIDENGMIQDWNINAENLAELMEQED